MVLIDCIVLNTGLQNYNAFNCLCSNPTWEDLSVGKFVSLLAEGHWFSKDTQISTIIPEQLPCQSIHLLIYR